MNSVKKGEGGKLQYFGEEVEILRKKKQLVK